MNIIVGPQGYKNAGNPLLSIKKARKEIMAQDSGFKNLNFIPVVE